LLVTGGFITIVPLIALFLLLQRYWRGGALLGSLTGLRVRRCAGCAIATGPGGRVRLADRAAARPPARPAQTCCGPPLGDRTEVAQHGQLTARYRHGYVTEAVVQK
jgi:hypothetical protein